MISKMREWDVEAMQEVLENYNINVSYDKASNIASDFIDCYMGNREAETPVNYGGESNFDKIQRLERELEKCKYELNTATKANKKYESSLCKMLDVQRIYTDGDRIYTEK